MLLEVGDTGILNTKNFLPLSDSHQLLLCGEALKQSGNMQQSLMWLPSNMMLMSYGYTVSKMWSQIFVAGLWGTWQPLYTETLPCVWGE